MLKEKPILTKDEEEEVDGADCMQKNMFQFSYVIGIGGFGKVWRVEHKKTNQIYAMKEMSKAL